MKKVFIICSIEGTSPGYKKKLEDYTKSLEDKGIEVHLPHRDTNQETSSYEICNQNTKAIVLVNEVHVFYNPNSENIHFDMGVAFAYGKKIVVVENVEYDEGKSYPRMLDEWAKIFKDHTEDDGYSGAQL